MCWQLVNDVKVHFYNKSDDKSPIFHCWYTHICRYKPTRCDTWQCTYPGRWFPFLRVPCIHCHRYQYNAGSIHVSHPTIPSFLRKLTRVSACRSAGCSIDDRLASIVIGLVNWFLRWWSVCSVWIACYRGKHHPLTCHRLTGYTSRKKAANMQMTWPSSSTSSALHKRCVASTQSLLWW